MNIKPINYLFILLISITTTNKLYAQNSDVAACSNLVINYNSNIKNTKYLEASKNWEQMLKVKCTLSEFDYYNAACIYSTLKQEKLALKYLNISVNKGYYDTAHMAVDADLDNIRNTEAFKKIPSTIINKIKEEKKQEEIEKKKATYLDWQSQFDNKQKQKWQFLKSFFAKVNPKEFNNLIPYSLNNNWGYMDKSGKAVTKAIFEFADFSSKHGLLFKYKNEYFFYTLKGDIDKLKANIKEPEYAMRLDDKYNIENFDTPGFKIDDGRIVGYNKEYVNIEILPTKSNTYFYYNEIFGSKTWAIVTKKDNHIAIIDSVGNPLNNIFNFSYKIGENENFWSTNFNIENRILYKLKNDNYKELFYEINGEEFKADKEYNAINYFWWDKNNFGNKLFTVYLYNNGNFDRRIKINFADNTTNILALKNNQLKVLFNKYYTDIIGINGVTDNWFNGFVSQYFTDKITNKVYFLVKENDSIFYVDADGVEYKLKGNIKL